MDLNLIIAIIGSQALGVFLKGIFDAFVGRGKRDRLLRKELIDLERTNMDLEHRLVEKRRVAYQWRHLAELAGIDTTPWPPWPEAQ